MPRDVSHPVRRAALPAWLRIADWFRSSPSRGSHYALTLLNESLATALGNGYVHAKLTGKQNEGNWYRDKYINLMAKQIYPLVNEYLSSGRAIDQAFVDRYIQTYDTSFPEWLFEVEHVPTGRYVLVDDPNTVKTFEQKFPSRAMTQVQVGISDDVIAAMARTRLSKVVLISKDHQRALQRLKQGFGELADWTPSADEDFTYSRLLTDRTYLIVINAVKKTVQEQLNTLRLKQ